MTPGPLHAPLSGEALPVACPPQKATEEVGAAESRSGRGHELWVGSRPGVLVTIGWRVTGAGPGQVQGAGKELPAPILGDTGIQA